jgi:hypothetical protein
LPAVPVTKKLEAAPQPKSVTAAVETFRRDTLENLAAQRLSLSPDEQRIAYIDAGHLYVLRLGSGEVQSPGDANGVPFWSPDSRSIAAASGKRLMRFDLDGSAPRDVCGVNSTLTGAWGPDGTILMGFQKDGIYRVPAAGGTAVRVTTIDPSRNETRHLAPQFLPGGRRFLYIAGSGKAGQSMLYVGSLESAERKEIMPVESNVEFVSSRRVAQQGYLVFTMGRVLTAKTFNLTTLNAGARTLPIGELVTSTGTIDAAVSTGDFSATKDLLAFRPMASRSGITVIRGWMDRLDQQTQIK